MTVFRALKFKIISNIQNEDEERMDAEAVKQAVTDAISSWGETNVPPFL
ncbi:BnaA04g29390D [Brassica napus]|uniref:BnaA04g29390D protein n=1 Tax=Brassica napus TaxID=3708 RepID=A0A078ISH0_BRANA|nr:BnaA04g29390D [Brassica napus]